MTENITVIQPRQRKQILLFEQYKNLTVSTPSKFEQWVANIDERWLAEVATCIQGNFPDWRA
ncbi:MAG: hypothetical protein F6J86_03395 [Symploca sp. SIO1B1]|nr:hypothetical protein [Symploca sp. SIO1C2]NER92893.1 hypothetical protein [Symploca sp. SIO1B1]